MPLIKFEKNSYGYIFKLNVDGTPVLIDSTNNPEFDAWLIVNGEPPLNTELDLKSPLPPGAVPPSIEV